jgi:hypothetical protein
VADPGSNSTPYVFVTGSPPVIGDVAVFSGPNAIKDGGAATGLGVVIVDTAHNILSSTATKGLIAFSTDYDLWFIADGTQWWLGSNYFNIQPDSNDLGYLAFSNRQGYGKNYVTDKRLSNCNIGNNANSTDGSIQYDPTTQLLKINVGGTYQTIGVGVTLRNLAQYRYSVQQQPLTEWINVFSGDSIDVGLNGLPLTQGYRTSIGAYPPPQTVSGGTF